MPTHRCLLRRANSAANPRATSPTVAGLGGLPPNETRERWSPASNRAEGRPPEIRHVPLADPACLGRPTRRFRPPSCRREPRQSHLQRIPPSTQRKRNGDRSRSTPSRVPLATIPGCSASMHKPLIYNWNIARIFGPGKLKSLNLAVIPPVVPGASESLRGFSGPTFVG